MLVSRLEYKKIERDERERERERKRKERKIIHTNKKVNLLFWAKA